MNYNPDLLVPFGYGRTLRTLRELRGWLLVHHHPEYVRRLVGWLSSRNGLIGVGGGWRADGTQPTAAGFAPEGKSFHQNQRYADGFVGAAAVDLVCRNGANVHRAPTWAEVPRQGSAAAKAWGLHCNIDTEPWHMQPIEIDGWQSWVNAGSPAPQANYLLPTELEPSPEEPPMIITAAKLANVDTAPPVTAVAAGTASEWLLLALLKVVLGADTYTQGAADRLNARLAALRTVTT